MRPDPAPLKVLYVDDEPDIREVVALSLSLDPGIELLLCGSPEEALHAAGGFAPDLIMLDVMMPVMDGPSLMAALRTVPGLRETPVIFCTARTQEREADRLRALGASGIIEKPFDPMHLARRVRALAAVPSG